jgi:hypothetical protein
MGDDYSPNVTEVIDSYEAFFLAPPPETLPFRLKAQAANDLAIVVYLPEDPEATTLLGTAGLSAFAVGDGFRAEIAMEVKASVDPAVRRELADAIVTLAAAPLKTGRPFVMNQTLGKVRLPLFDKLGFAMLVDWDPTYGFVLPKLPEPVTLLRLVPLFESEAAYIEAQPDGRRGYLDLVNMGMEPEDHEREPVA